MSVTDEQGSNPRDDPNNPHMQGKDAELMLHQTTQKLRAILESAIDFSIITLDIDGYIVDWNSGAERMFGYNRKEAIGQYTDIIFTPEDKYGSIPAVEIKKAVETGRSLDERWHLRKDDTRFFMSGVMSPIYHNDAITGFVKIARDITDRKITEEALFLSEQRRSLVQSAQIGEWDWDILSGTVEKTDPVCKLLGLQPGKSYEQAGPFFSMIHEDDQEQVKQQMKTALDGLNIFQSECRIIREDNKQEKWISVYGRVIAHKEGRPAKMIGVVYDITDRKLLEKQKDEFISVASHELKTPVTSIKGYSQILQEIFEETGEKGNAATLKKLNEQVNRLVKLIHTLLDMTNVTEGKLTLNIESFDLNRLLDERIQELQLISKTHTLIWKPGNIGLINADRDRVGQVITNIISNAIKYSPGESEVVISTEDSLDGVVVRVRDFGMGISPEDQARIFQQYYRVGAEEVRNNPGLGLGLYISSEIIKQHGGSIGVESIAGEGSTFNFKLVYS